MIMITTTTLLKTLLFLLALVLNVHRSHSNFAGVCQESERMALLKLKAEFIDDYGRLSSWESRNCCEWDGVVCDNRTNHVVALHLNGPAPLRGKISPSLLQLSHLQYLDLSGNGFYGTRIPKFIGSLRNLQHLNLSHSYFGGQIPHHIGNLSLLKFLDLSDNWALTDTNIDWLSGFTSLQYLDLSSSPFIGSTKWLQVIDKLTVLRELYLSNCELPVPVSAPPSLNSSSNSLVVLDLSANLVLDSSVLLWFLNKSSSFTYIDMTFNNLEGEIPDALGNLTSLSHLDLSSNKLREFPMPSKNSSSLTFLDLSFNSLNGQLSHLLTWLWDSTRLQFVTLRTNALTGPFPNMSRFSNLHDLRLHNNELEGTLLEDNLRLPRLENLDLSNNNFTGRLPDLSSFPSLKYLILDNNGFCGSLTRNIGHLSKIEVLDAGYNLLEGVISEIHLSIHPHLTSLDLSFNVNISISIDPSWVHPIQFIELFLANCKIGPHFPEWLQKQNKLKYLDISNSGILGTVPSWFWGNIQMCWYLNMSHNQIYGVLPDMPSTFQQISDIDLSSNQFSGSLPSLPNAFSNIYLSGNKFSGTILKYCNYKDISLYLDLSDNLLSGEIPSHCFMNLLSLFYVNLDNNNFSGVIPKETDMACNVFSLHLRNNSFRGEISKSFYNCSRLRILDLGENKLSGKIPRWFGERLQDLVILVLNSNLLYGGLPSSLCHLSYMQVLDISLNRFTGNIPNCLNFSIEDPDFWQSGVPTNFYDSASFDWKGKEVTYINTLGLVKLIDLSSNELVGEIPPQLMTLIGLVGLNLSRNNLVGPIPRDIDKLELLNFLDLSRNNLSGSIPPTLSKLSHLGVLDLSFNDLSGRIPWDTHMQTFEASTYIGNSRLCGPPLSRKCPEDEKPSNNGKGTDDSGDDDKLITKGFYMSMLIGFISAFWMVFWILFFNKWWNSLSMKICTTVVDSMYVFALVKRRRLLRYFLGDN